MAIRKLSCVFLLLLAGNVYAGEDKHFVQDDDYFIAANEELGDAGWVDLQIGKMITPVGPKTKNEAQFLQIADGEKVWTRNFFKTRIAKKEEIKIGAYIVFPNLPEEDGYRSPEDKAEARRASWAMAVVTDVSDLFKNQVGIPDGRKVRLDAARVAFLGAKMDKPLHRNPKGIGR